MKIILPILCVALIVFGIFAAFHEPKPVNPELYRIEMEIQRLAAQKAAALQ